MDDEYQKHANSLYETWLEKIVQEYEAERSKETTKGAENEEELDNTDDDDDANADTVGSVAKRGTSQNLRGHNTSKKVDDEKPSPAALKLKIWREACQGVSQADLLRKYQKYGFSKRQIHRLAHAKGRFDNSSRPGRATALLRYSEVALKGGVRKPPMKQWYQK